MKGIAITLAAREDGEAIGRIEKLVGHKIPRTSEALAEAPAKAEKPERPEKAVKAQKAPAKVAAPKRERSSEPKPAKPAERSPVVEDIDGEWNGPMPSFLSVSAG